MVAAGWSQNRCSNKRFNLWARVCVHKYPRPLNRSRESFPLHRRSRHNKPRLNGSNSLGAICPSCYCCCCFSCFPIFMLILHDNRSEPVAHTVQSLYLSLRSLFLSLFSSHPRTGRSSGIEWEHAKGGDAEREEREEREQEAHTLHDVCVRTFSELYILRGSVPLLFVSVSLSLFCIAHVTLRPSGNLLRIMHVCVCCWPHCCFLSARCFPWINSPFDVVVVVVPPAVFVCVCAPFRARGGWRGFVSCKKQQQKQKKHRAASADR